MKIMIDQSSLVLGGDYISLSQTVTLHKNYIYDNVLDTKYYLLPNVKDLIVQLNYLTPYELLYEYARSHDLKDYEISNLVNQLNNLGILEIKKSVKSFKIHTSHTLRNLILGKFPTLLVERNTVTISNLSLIILKCMIPLIFCIFALDALSTLTNISSSITILSSLFFIVLVFISTLIHEWAHSLIITVAKGKQILIRRGLRLGVMHKPLLPKIEILSALLGPCLGALICIITGLVFNFIHPLKINHSLNSSFLHISMFVAALQMISLLPAYGDGKSILISKGRLNRE